MRSQAAHARTFIGLAMVAILVATLTPTSGPVSSYKCLICGDRGIADSIANTMLFIPLGVALGFGLASARWVYLVPFVFSFLVEFTQQFIPGRDPSIGDVVFNTLGGLLGVTIARTSARWLDPSPTTSSRLSLFAATWLAITILLTGYFLRPDFPPTTYWGLWTPDLGHLEWYRAHLESVQVGALEAASGPMEHQPELHQALRRGDAVRMIGTAGPPVTRLGALFAIYDENQQEILLVGPRKTDLVLRYRTRGTSIGLDQPEVNLSGAMKGFTPIDSLDVTYRRSATGICLEVKGRARQCGLGFTAGRGWALIAYDERIPGWLQPALDAAWLLALALPIGFWSTRRGSTTTAFVISGGALILLPGLVGLRPTSVWELVACAAGVYLGNWLRRQSTIPGSVGEIA